ncbi:tyrosine-type recombinase/integrase [Haloprofundus salinisoli]|uniref:tyrosine-type recombinase/integrase n=1 Tax=Haloprofundus salinisoli TaxID=2876193 RepID=UPI001CCD532A|nr:site-specific integrase [Haloprofundus salinisoli]
MSNTNNDTDDDPRGPYASLPDVETLPDPAQEYIEDSKYTVSKRGYLNRKSSIRHYAVFCAETGRDLLAPGKYAIRKFQIEQRKHGYSDSTISNRVYDLSKMFRTFQDRAEDPNETVPPELEGIKNPMDEAGWELLVEREDNKDPRYIEIEDYKKILEVVEKLRDLVLLRLLWDTGVRARELVSLRLDKIIWEERAIETVTVKQEGESEWREIDDEDTDRTVYFTPKTERYLREWIEGGARDGFLSASESPYILVGRQSMQLNPRRPTEIVDEYAEMAGVQEPLGPPNAAGEQRRAVTAHTFRHSYAVHRVKKGMPIPFLKELMGHSDIEHTEMYLRFKGEDKAEAERKYRPIV